MKNKRIMLVMLIIILLIITIIPNRTYAAADDSSVPSISDIIKSGNDFIAEGESKQDTTIKMDNVNNTVNFLYAIAVGIGLLLATIIGIILGAKFMLSASAEDKAKYKQQLVAFVVGVLVVSGAFGIWKIVVNTLNTATPDGTASITKVASK